MSPDPIPHLMQDPPMERLVRHFGPIEFRPTQVPTFESLARAIVYQQLSGKAAATIFARFRALFPGPRFPSAERVLQTDPERLRQAGLSRAKAAYILDLASRVRRRTVPSLKVCQTLSDDEIICRLTEVKGVGRWTAQMLLIFNLGRPDVLAEDDLGIRRGFQVACRLDQPPSPRMVAQHALRWAPFRSQASLYLWKAAGDPPP